MNETASKRIGHNEIAAIVRDELTQAGEDPSLWDWTIYNFAAGYNGEREEASIRRHWREHVSATPDSLRWWREQ